MVDFVSHDFVDGIIHDISMSGAERSYVLFTLDLENKPATVNGMKGYEVEVGPAPGDSFRGLGQFGRPAWSDVMDEPFEMVGTPRLDILAIVRLYRRNRAIFTRNFPGVPFTNEIAYLLHNQGAGAGPEYLRTGVLRFPGQSNHALEVMENAYLQVQQYA